MMSGKRQKTKSGMMSGKRPLYCFQRQAAIISASLLSTSASVAAAIIIVFLDAQL